MLPNGHSAAETQIDVEELASEHGSFQDLCATLDVIVTNFLREEASTPALARLQEQTRVAIDVCEEALRKYTLKHLSLSYNGGKDCLVLLILYLVAIHRHLSRGDKADEAFPAALESIYIQVKHPFTEVSTFVLTSAAHYRLKLSTSAKPMKEAFQDYLDQHSEVQAIFVGTRRTDPHGAKLKHFDPTDGGWPAFMRIHPVIDWHYADIWAFLRHFEIPYCSLYDKGFTSLGGTDDTHPNPALRIDGETAFRPAYELQDDYEERLGRDR